MHAPRKDAQLSQDRGGGGEQNKKGGGGNSHCELSKRERRD